MKKVLTILLTLVMAVCLINLNNSHIKAEGNEDVTVTFDMQGHGTQVPSQTFAASGLATKPNDPSSVGYTFGGWYEEATCTTEWDFNTPVTENKTLFAEWNKIGDPFTITAMEDGTNLILNKNGDYTPPTLKYSIDGGDATDYQYDHTISVNKGQKVSFITTTAQATPLSENNNKFIKVVVNKKITASGNIMSLVDKDNFSTNKTIPGNNYCFYQLFRDCTNLTSIDGLELPATTLKDSCYKNMFFGCKGLTSIPEGLLPAQTLQSDCYTSMFQYCTGLTSIPEKLLPATTLSSTCYAYMFYDCTGLSSIPEKLLPGLTLAGACYCSMFENCTNLINIPNLPAPGTLPDECYANMFKGCSSLKLSTSKDANYIIPFSITYSEKGTSSLLNMFYGTTGSFTGEPTSTTIYYVSKDTTAPEVEATAAKNGTPAVVSITEDSGSQAVIHLKGYENTYDIIELDNTTKLISGTDFTIIKINDPASNAGDYDLRLSKLLISSLPVGQHGIKVYKNGSADAWLITINILAKPSPSPSEPSKKDESCEKVIGPTWHWNNDKGICEDYGVVGTSTR